MGDTDIVTLRVQQIRQLGDFITLASDDKDFREQLQAIFDMPDADLAAKEARMDAMKNLFAANHIVYSKERYDTLTSLYLARFMKEGEVYQLLRDFATAFGHPNIGVFN